MHNQDFQEMLAKVNECLTLLQQQRRDQPKKGWEVGGAMLDETIRLQRETIRDLREENSRLIQVCRFRGDPPIFDRSEDLQAARGLLP